MGTRTGLLAQVSSTSNVNGQLTTATTLHPDSVHLWYAVTHQPEML